MRAAMWRGLTLLEPPYLDCNPSVLIRYLWLSPLVGLSIMSAKQATPRDFRGRMVALTKRLSTWCVAEFALTMVESFSKRSAGISLIPSGVVACSLLS
jgi:hypothetical protein